MSIPQLSESEGITHHYVAKLARLLRIGGYINSTPGYKGGYILAKPADQIIINNVLKTLGGTLYNKTFCTSHTGNLNICNHTVDCSARSLWQIIQFTVDELLNKVTLQHLLNSEQDSASKLNMILKNKEAFVHI